MGNGLTPANIATESFNLANHTLYIVTAGATFSSRFQEVCDLVMASCAFAQPSSIWFSAAAANELCLHDIDAPLAQLIEFGARCFSEEALAERHIEASTLPALRNQHDQILVF